MSDIVERLVSAGNDQISGLPLLQMTVEAANEIEQLRAERDALRARIEGASSLCESLMAEAEREGGPIAAGFLEKAGELIRAQP